jgi:UDP-N-acetylglucosamine--dolichyl-phosphate N-acetylglucosaminephosphotransferase
MILRYIIIPVYIMVVANLKNMHAGFNGLQSGTALIILSFILLKSWLDSNLDNMYTIAALIGAQAVFFWHNKYPSKILEGNIGSLAVGAAIGAALVIQHYLIAGIIMLMPHIINFLMYVYWRAMNSRHPDDERWKIVKFGKVRPDGTLEVPNQLTLKWVLPYHFRMTEQQVVYSMYVLTLGFCAIGLFIPA